MKKILASILALTVVCGIALAGSPYDGRAYSVTDTSLMVLPAVNPGVQTVWTAGVTNAVGDYIRAYRANGDHDYYWCITAGISTNATPTFITTADVGDGTTTWRYVNPVRNYYTVQNDGAGVVYLSFGDQAAVANQGTRLNASGGTLLRNESPYQGEVRAISTASLTNVVLVQELPK